MTIPREAPSESSSRGNAAGGSKSCAVEPKKLVLAAALIFLLTVVVFLPALENGFSWDDDRLLLEHDNYHGLGPTNLQWMFTTNYTEQYHPITWLSYALDYKLWEMKAVGYHLSNILLHAAGAVLFYFVTVKLLRSALAGSASGTSILAAAFVATLLFALHPLRVECVAWATGRRDLLSGFFFLGAILAYLRFAERRGKDGSSGLGRLGLSLLLFALSLLSKASGVMLPVLLLVLDVYPLRRLRTGPNRRFRKAIRDVLLEKAPYFVMAGTFMYLALRAQGKSSLGALQWSDIGARVGQASYGLIFYVWKTVLPLGLLPLYQLPDDMSALTPVFAASAALVAGITLALLLLRRRAPWALAAWVSYGVLLLPVR